jgi:hypothetical protein
LAASDIIWRLHGGSNTTWTSASAIPGIDSSLPLMSSRSTSPMPQPGAVSVNFTSILFPPFSTGVSARL